MYSTVPHLCRALSSRLRRTTPAHSSLIRRQSSSSNPDNDTAPTLPPFNPRFEDDKSSAEIVETMDREVQPAVHVAWDGEVWDQERIARSVSRMRPYLRDRMYHVNKVPIPLFSLHQTKDYKRRVYARFGRESGVNPGWQWPSREEVDNLRHHENETLKLPTLQESWARVNLAKETKLNAAKKRDEDITKAMKKMKDDIQALHDRQRKADQLLQVERKKREKLMDEAREILGYTLDPRDKRFQELIEAKEKEQQKLAKQQKKKEREAKAVARLTADASTTE